MYHTPPCPLKVADVINERPLTFMEEGTKILIQSPQAEHFKTKIAVHLYFHSLSSSPLPMPEPDSVLILASLARYKDSLATDSDQPQLPALQNHHRNPGSNNRKRQQKKTFKILKCAEKEKKP